MAKWLRREHSNAEKRNGFKLFLTDNSYCLQKWPPLAVKFLALHVWKTV